MTRFVKLAMIVMMILTLLVPVMAFAEEDEWEEGDPPLSVEVSLCSNPSTGYVWQYECDCESVLEVIYNGFYSSDETLMGAPGIDDFTLSGLEEGFAKVTFTCIKPSDGDVLLTVIYNVQVMENSDVLIYDTTVLY